MAFIPRERIAEVGAWTMMHPTGVSFVVRAREA